MLSTRGVRRRWIGALVFLGLLTLSLSSAILSSLPFSLDASSWYSFGSWLALLGVSALTFHAFRLALGSRPLVQELRPRT